MDINNIKKFLGGKIFTVEFIKKNGDKRVMHCRQGVTKYLTGGAKRYDTDRLNYLTVYDLKAKGYRTINLNTVNWIKANGMTIIPLDRV